MNVWEKTRIMRIFVFIIAFCFLATTGAFATSTGKTTAASKLSARAQLPPSAAKAKKTVKKKRYKRKLKYVAPPVDELSSEALPVELPIPIELVETIAKGNVDEASRMLRTEAPSSRSLYLLAEMKRILDFENGNRPAKYEKHRFYQNLGIAYHNLFLFLRRNGMANKEFYDNAIKFYKKSGKSRAFSEKYESQLLTAAIMAANGEIDAAEKLFGGIDTSIITDNDRGYAYIATFYAAVENVEKTIESLKQAYIMNPGQIKLWASICDDFASMKSNPDFVRMVSEWK